VIIGNGVAGISAALAARQRDASATITVVSGETPYYFSRTALMYSYMDIMKRQDLEPYERSMYRKQRIALVHDWVVDHNASTKTLTLKNGHTLPYDALVLAVGSKPNMFSWPGADRVKDGLVHFVSMQDLDACERLTPSTKRAVVVGGGLIGIELVECLRFHGVDVTFLIREPYYWPVALASDEAEYVAEHIRHHGIDLRLKENMEEIRVDEAGRISGIRTDKEDIECQMLGICIGVHPMLEGMEAWGDKPETGRGILVDRTLKTSLPDVYACGDCAEIVTPGEERNLLEQIWYSAKRQGKLVGRNLFGDEVKYTPPTFFNSSKFFEIEYTTVGEVVRVPDGTPSRYYKMPNKDISVRIVHDNEKVLGFNMLGSRWNHEILQRWVDERRSPQFVYDHLPEAQYDVEFGRAALAKMSISDVPMVFTGRA
ncbi:MAG: FAD/NAD(P)-binding oxidoreductase, partial [Myxococcota bacterium]